jgi:hypothetical protein
MGKGHAIQVNEALPGYVAAQDAAGSQRQVFQAERSQEVRPLRVIGMSGSGQTVVELRAHRVQGDAELVAC